MDNPNPNQMAHTNIDNEFNAHTINKRTPVLHPLKELLNNFCLLKKQLEVEKTDRYKCLLNKWMSISEKLLVFNKIDTPDYNVFKILKIPQLKYMEDEVHTPILGNLLNTRGSHHQGKLFYELFLKICIEEESLRQKFLLNDYSKLFVEEEKSTSNGRIDILITCHDFDKSFAICIENKINAVDQCGQLNRYQEILSSKYIDYIIFYLTPNGSYPSSRSISDEKLINLTSNGKLKIISYSNHIKTFLNCALESISSKKLAGTLKQYLEII